MKKNEKMIQETGYIDRLQAEYDVSFQAQDLIGMVKYSGALSVAYSAISHNALADKWMDEYAENLEKLQPGLRTKLETIRSLLPS